MRANTLTMALRRALFPLIAFAAIAGAKEPTRKLIISGGGLAGLIEITDSATLALADMYAGNVLDTTRAFAPAPDGLPRYEISLYLVDKT